ncbi:MAG: hypothetical protein WD960_01255 [Gemmatimonadota bacterium]
MKIGEWMTRGEWGTGTWAAALAIGLSVLGGCAEDGPRGAAGSVGFQEWDSAGVRVVESSGEALETFLPWTVDTLPDLEIGHLFGEASTQFHRIGGITSAPGGEVVVVDGGSAELRWFAASGEARLALGGEGDGPGDFRAPRLIRQFAGDSLLIFDQIPRRFTWVAKDGSGHRAQPMPSGGPPLLAGAPVAAKDERVAFRTGGGNFQGEGLVDAPLSVRWVDLVRSTVDTIAHYGNHSLVFRRSGRALPTILAAPFEPAGLVAVRPEGLIVEGSRPFELRYLDDTGRLSGIARVDAPGRPVDSEARDRLARDWSASESGPNSSSACWNRWTFRRWSRRSNPSSWIGWDGRGPSSSVSTKRTLPPGSSSIRRAGLRG